jgi:hypothetical protein
MPRLTPTAAEIAEECRAGCSNERRGLQAPSHWPSSSGATVASTVTYLLPVVAIVLGVLVLSETITATLLGGIALVLAGVALTRAKRGKSVPNEESHRSALPCLYLVPTDR